MTDVSLYAAAITVCTQSTLLYTRFANIYGTSVSEAAGPQVDHTAALEKVDLEALVRKVRAYYNRSHCIWRFCIGSLYYSSSPH